ALEAQAAVGEFGVLRLFQERVQPARAFHRLESVRADAQAHLALKRIADQRHVHEIGPKRTLGLVLSMAAQLARHGALASQLTTPGHSRVSFCARLRGICFRRAVLYKKLAASSLYHCGTAVTEFFTPRG